MSCGHEFNSLPNKFLDEAKMKDFSDDKINVTEKLNFVLGGVENIVGKGENADYQHFPKMFSKGFLYRVVKSWDCVVKSEANYPISNNPFWIDKTPQIFSV